MTFTNDRQGEAAPAESSLDTTVDTGATLCISVTVTGLPPPRLTLPEAMGASAEQLSPADRHPSEVGATCMIYEMRPVSSRQSPGDPEVEWEERGSTEIARVENGSVNFDRSINIDFEFGSIQPMQLKIFYMDRSGQSLETELVGGINWFLTKLLTSPKSTLTLPLRPKGKMNESVGTVILSFVLDRHHEHLNVTLRAEGLPLWHLPIPGKGHDSHEFYDHHSEHGWLRRQVDAMFCHKHSPMNDLDPGLASMGLYLQVESENDDGEYSLVCTSGTIRPEDDKTPLEWSLGMEESEVTHGDPTRLLRLRLYDMRRFGQDKLLSEGVTCYADLHQEGQLIPLSRPRSSRNPISPPQLCGGMRVANSFSSQAPGFADFVVGGCEICLSCAVDFSTVATGDKDPLHYRPNNGQGLTPCMDAIRAVGTILNEFDSDKMYPICGFGGTLGEKKKNKSGLFSLAQHMKNKEVEGVGGLLKAYSDALPHIRQESTATVAPVIRWAAEQAKRTTKGRLKYHVLLVFTRGSVSDMQDTTDAIVEASGLPLSIILVGIGNGDFAQMEALDADSIPLVHRNGKEMERDIVQFVPFGIQKGMGESVLWKSGIPPLVLARVVLEELPAQFLSYWRKEGVVPDAGSKSKLGRHGGHTKNSLMFSMICGGQH